MGLLDIGRWRSVLLRTGAGRAEAESGRTRITDEVSDWQPLLAAGRFAEALRSVGSFDGESIADAGLQFARGTILRAWGRHAEATRAVDRAWDLGDRRPALLALKGWSAERIGQPNAAADCYRQAREAGDHSLQTAMSLAATLAAAGQFDAARALHAELGAISAEVVPVILLAGLCELRANRPVAAADYFERATRMSPDDALAWEHLGIALLAADRPAEALAALERGTEVAANAAPEKSSFVNRAIALCELGRPAEAVAILEEGLRIRPETNGHLQVGAALLTIGAYVDGWRQYENRWLAEPLIGIRAQYGVPQWTGQPLHGRTVLVRSEQGLGDVFQFVRYLPMLKARGARVLFQPLKDMDRIARRFPGIDAMVVEGELLPPFDFFVNLMSLPAAFGTTVSSIPCDVPYLTPDPAFSSKWRPRFDDRRVPRVGLVWAGSPRHRSDRHRSLALSQLASLFAIPGIRYVSLQKGSAAAQAAIVPGSVDWEDVGSDLDLLDDAAAVLAELDLLVCVDTGLAHLAAAMGKPVWMMVPHPADYRWLTDREDTPWYPTMRLFRQSRLRDWTSVIDRVTRELARWRAAWRPDQLPAAPRIERGVEPGVPVADPPPLTGLASVAETNAGLLRYMPDADRSARSLERLGEWLQPQIDFLGRFVRPGMTLVEAGAGIGAHAILLARAIGYDGLMLLYEERRPIRHLLADNLSLHRLPHASVMSRSLGRGIPEGAEEPRDTLDDLQLTRLDGLKLNEAVNAIEVVAGADQTLWRCRPWVMVTDPDTATVPALREALLERSYRIWRSDVPLFRPGNFNRREIDEFGGATARTFFALPEEVDPGAPVVGWSEWT